MWKLRNDNESVTQHRITFISEFVFFWKKTRISKVETQNILVLLKKAALSWNAFRCDSNFVTESDPSTIAWFVSWPLCLIGHPVQTLIEFLAVLRVINATNSILQNKWSESRKASLPTDSMKQLNKILTTKANKWEECSTTCNLRWRLAPSPSRIDWRTLVMLWILTC